MSLPDDFPELHQFGTSPKVSDGFEEFLKQTQMLAPTTTESFALEVIRPGRPGDELDDEADGERIQGNGFLDLYGTLLPFI